jgi:hypothetical protein
MAIKDQPHSSTIFKGVGFSTPYVEIKGVGFSTPFG